MEPVTFDAPQPDGSVVSVTVRPLSRWATGQARQVYEREFRRAVSAGVPTLKKLTPRMHAEWDAAKQARNAELVAAVTADEAVLAEDKVALDERRAAAIRLRQSRAALRSLRAGVDALAESAAESRAKQAEFDELVTVSTLHADGSRVFANRKTFVAQRQSELAVAVRAHWAMAQGLLGLRPDFEETLPENVFLRLHPSC